MTTIWAHAPSYTISEYLPIKKGNQTDLKFRMIIASRPYVRESGESYLSNTAYAEYEFGGKVIAEMAINGALILIVDTGNFQFYIENGQAADTHQTNNNFGKFIKGKGRLTPGEYPYQMGVEGYHATVEDLIKVNIPESRILDNNGELSYPVYLSPTEYTEVDTQQINEIDNNNDDGIFYLIKYQLS